MSINTDGTSFLISDSLQGSPHGSVDRATSIRLPERQKDGSFSTPSAQLINFGPLFDEDDENNATENDPFIAPEDDVVWHDDRDTTDAFLLQQLEQLHYDLDSGVPVGDDQLEALHYIEKETADINTYIHVQKAALYVTDCLLGHHYPVLDSKIKLYKFYRNKWVARLLTLTVMVNILLALSQTDLSAADGKKFTNEVRPDLIVLELWCFTVFSCQCLLQYKFLGGKQYFKNKQCVALLSCTVVYFIDMVFVPLFFNGAPIVSAASNNNKFFLRFYIRPIYTVLHFSGLRETIPSVIKTAVALVPVIMFLFIFLCIFGIYGFMLFHKRNDYFKSSPWALYQLLVTLTTANFPDVMIQSYAQPYEVIVDTDGPFYENSTGFHITKTTWKVRENDTTPFDFSWNAVSWHASPCFFIAFFLVGLYFLLSVAFAVVYNVYKEHLRKEVLLKYSFRQRMLGRAYYCLTQYIDEGYDEFNRRLCSLTQEVVDHGHKPGMTELGRERVNSMSRSIIDTTMLENHQLTDLSSAANAQRMQQLLLSFKAAKATDRLLESSSIPRPRRKTVFHTPELSEPSTAAASPQSSRQRQRTGTEVDLYVFTLIYDELFPNRLEAEIPEININSIVGLRETIPLENQIILKGTTGVVKSVPDPDLPDDQKIYEIVFHNGIVYSASRHQITFVERANSHDKMLRILFHAMDLNESGSLDMKQFRAFYQMLQLKVTVIKDSRLFIERVLPLKVFSSRAVQSILKFGRSKWLDRIVDMLIFMSCCFMTIHFEYIARMKVTPDGDLSDTWFTFMYVEMVIGTIFDIEAGLKILSFGWTQYWSKKWNRFDFVVTVINTSIYITFGVLASIYGVQRACFMVTEIHSQDINSNDQTPDLIMIVLLGRLLRSIRIVSENRSFRYIMKTFSNILPIFASYIAALLIVYYYFACLGMLVFKGVVPPPGTEYSNSNYYALNFESFYQACVTLWCLMVVNNWFVIVDGYRAASGNWVLVYFISFWLISVLLIMNIVTALVVEVWGSQWEINKQKAINIEKNPLAVRINKLNKLTPDDGDAYYRLGLPPDPDGSRPTFRVSYSNYSHKVRLALERIFLQQKGFEHVIV